MISSAEIPGPFRSHACSGSSLWAGSSSTVSVW